MMNIQQVLEKRKARNKLVSKFITLSEGESVLGTFLGVEEQEDPKYGTRVVLKFNVGGVEKTYSRPATGPTYELLNTMMQLSIVEGDTVKLTRLKSDDKASRYDVQNLSAVNTGSTANVDNVTSEVKNDTSEIDNIFGK